MNDLIDRAECLVQEVNKTHRYSVTRVYDLYNEIFNKKEPYQSCGSCLRRKVNSIELWLKENKIASDVE